LQLLSVQGSIAVKLLLGTEPLKVLRLRHDAIQATISAEVDSSSS
jgi:hypothetical protein